MTNEIKYVTGDATWPIKVESRMTLIVHITNDVHAWGSGFVMALSKRWNAPHSEYAESASTRNLGNCQFVLADVDENEQEIYVANMTAQTGIGRFSGPPIRYDALTACLIQVRFWALKHGAAVHMPRIGTARAGGDWDVIWEIIADELLAHGVPVIVYDYDGTEFK